MSFFHFFFYMALISKYEIAKFKKPFDNQIKKKAGRKMENEQIRHATKESYQHYSVKLLTLFHKSFKLAYRPARNAGVLGLLGGSEVRFWDEIS